MEDRQSRLGDPGRSPHVGVRQLGTSFAVLSLVVPPILAFALRSKVRAMLFGMLWFWLLLVVGAQYNLATDPNYDSIAPGITIVFGWLPGLLYAGLCVLAATCGNILRHKLTTRLER